MDDEAGQRARNRGGVLEALYRRYSDGLRRALRRRFGADAAEDLVQEAYLRLARSGQAEDAEHPRALLMKIAVNAGVDRARYDRRRGGDGSAALLPDFESSPSDQAEVLLLKEIVLSLPPILRDVFVLSRFAGLSYGEIATRLGISVKTVEWRMSRALAICAERLRDR